MLEFHEKRKLVQFLHNKYFLGFLLIPIGFLSYVAHNAYEAERDTYERRVALEAQLAALDERSAVLEQDIAELADPYGIEAELRRRYDVGHEGEETIILVEGEADEVYPNEEMVPEDIEEGQGWWRRVTGWW